MKSQILAERQNHSINYNKTKRHSYWNTAEKEEFFI